MGLLCVDCETYPEARRKPCYHNPGCGLHWIQNQGPVRMYYTDDKSNLYDSKV